MVLGGCDVLVFAGGIGLNSPTVRTKSLEGTAGLGFVLDEAKNTGPERPTAENPGCGNLRRFFPCTNPRGPHLRGANDGPAVFESGGNERKKTKVVRGRFAGNLVPATPATVPSLNGTLSQSSLFLDASS